MTQLSSELSELQGSIRKYCHQSLEPILEEDDEKQVFRPELYSELGQLGLAGMTTAESFGGMGLGLSELAFALKEVARSSVSYAVTLSVSSMVQSIIQEYAHQDLKQDFLPQLASGKTIGSFCLSESGSGSDAASLKTQAKKEGDFFILNGSKLWISSAGFSSVYVVMARTGEAGAKGISAFLVPDGASGMSFGKKENKMGWRSSHTREVIFENCKVPKKNLLGKEGEGFKVALSDLDKGRITIGALAVGLAERALEEAVKFMGIRKQFEQSLFDFQGLQFLASECATELKASELMVFEAARRFDQGVKDPMLASMAKLKATDMAMEVTTECVQMLGGVGYTKEYPLERYMRDAKVLQIVEGTNQIQKIIIAKHLKKQFSE